MNENLNGHELQPKTVPCKVSWNNYPLPEPTKNREFCLPPLPDKVVQAADLGHKAIEYGVIGIWKVVVFLFSLAMIPLSLILLVVCAVGGVSAIHQLPTMGYAGVSSIIIFLLLCVLSKK